MVSKATEAKLDEVRGYIASAVETAKELRRDSKSIKKLLGVDFVSPFSESDAVSIQEKLSAARADLDDAQKSSDPEQGQRSLSYAVLGMNTALSTIQAEQMEFALAISRFRLDQRRRAIWDQYHREVEQFHEKFMSILKLASQVVGILAVLVLL